MPKYIYIASNKNGEMTEGEIEAAGESMVLDYLQKHELFPISVALSKKNRGGLDLAFFESVGMLDKILITRNLALMVKAGISISEAIDIMLEDAQKPILKRIFSHVKVTLEKGGQLSDSLAAFPKYFSPVFIQMLRAGEASGNLEGSLMQISTQLKKENDLRKKVKSAMAYPTILITAAFGVVILLVTVVLPRVGKIFTQAHLKLPLITRVLLGMSDFIINQWFLTLIILAMVSVTVYLVKKSAAGRAMFYNMTRQLPVISTLSQNITLARFNSVLHSLLKSGVPIMKALEITADALGNETYKKMLMQMTQQEISRGISFGIALKRRPEYFPRLVSSMIVVGERSGNLETMLEHLAGFYEEAVDDALKTMITVLEPALLLGVGLIIGALALSIIIPIYQMISAVR